MITKFKILTGTAEQVEKNLNSLTEKHDPMIQGCSVSEKGVIIVVELFPKPKTP